MKDGGYLRFNGMDFGKGAAGFRVEVSCENPQIRDARLEFRLDSPWGAIDRRGGGFLHRESTDYVVLTGRERRSRRAAMTSAWSPAAAAAMSTATSST